MLRIDDIPQQVADDIHAFGVIGMRECEKLLNCFTKYNKKHIFKPIHYISDIDGLPEVSSVFSVCIHMDFGNANPKALIGAVKAIAETNLPIYRVILE